MRANLEKRGGFRSSIVTIPDPASSLVCPSPVKVGFPAGTTQLGHRGSRAADRDLAFTRAFRRRPCGISEASITKRQRDEYKYLLAAESAKLAHVQQELQQHRLPLRCPRALKCQPVSGGGNQCPV